MRCLSLILIALLSITSLTAQNKRQVKNLATAKSFVNSYNSANYKGMNKTFMPLIRVILTKKKVKSIFEPGLRSNGKMSVDWSQAKMPSDNSVKFIVKYEKDSSSIDSFNLIFNKKSKITGFRVNTAHYNFPVYPANVVKSEMLDTILKYTYPDGFNGTILFADPYGISLLKSYGNAEVTGSRVLNDTSVFELASCSKQFTAAAILKLQEQNKLSVNDSLKKFFPGWPYKGMTVKHLLQHTSGLPDYMDALMSKKVKKEFLMNQDVIDWMVTKKPKVYFEPGQKYEYSNTGYVVLGSIIEQASGLSFADYLQKEFFTPLGMRHTRVYNTRRTKGEKLDNYAYGYVYSEKDKKYYLPDSLKDYSKMVTKLDGIVGDGTVNSTAPDLLKWDQSFYKRSVLSKWSIDSMYTKGKTRTGKPFSYGYGVEVAETADHGKIIAHTGGWPGYETLIYRFVDEGKVLILLCNKDNPSNNLMQAARKISGLYLRMN